MLYLRLLSAFKEKYKLEIKKQSNLSTDPARSFSFILLIVSPTSNEAPIKLLVGLTFESFQRIQISYPKISFFFFCMFHLFELIQSHNVNRH
jgi:hypothetical protein